MGKDRWYRNQIDAYEYGYTDIFKEMWLHIHIEVETYEYGKIFVYKWGYAPRNEEVNTYTN